MSTSKTTPIETSIGTLYVTAVNGTRVYVDGSGNGKSVTIRGRQYAISAGVTIGENGKLTPDYTQPDTIYINRLGDYSPFPTIGKTIVAAARQAILDAAREFIDKNPDALKVAAWGSWKMNYDRAMREAQDAQNKYYAALRKVEGKVVGYDFRENTWGNITIKYLDDNYVTRYVDVYFMDNYLERID